jgi:two-component system, cell cycle sensor histidine kinase and response regulator CckA
MGAPLETKRPIVLVVDDDVVTRNLVANLLHRANYSVLAAANGKEALELARNYPGQIDLLITDTAMPRMGGVELGEQIVRERPEIKVLLLCARPADEASAREGWRSLHKPLDNSLLRRTVTELVGG